MSTKHLTPGEIARTIHVIDASRIVDLIVPKRAPGQVGRIGAIRENTRLLLIGIHLTARLGHETTLASIHEVLTTALSVQTRCELGVLRPPTTSGNASDAPFDPQMPVKIELGVDPNPGDRRRRPTAKKPKRRWAGVEELSYDDLHNAVSAFRQRLDYGHGTAPDLDPATRAARRLVLALICDSLIRCTTIPRLGGTWAIDETGQWVWTVGHAKPKVKDGADGVDPSLPSMDDLTQSGIAIDDEGNTSPPTDAPAPASAKGRCLDAQWGYKTAKEGGREVGFGFHQHTICRVADPGADSDSEPNLVDGFVITPANADVVDVSLELIDRIRARHPFDRLLGDLLYTNLKASRWAVPLAQRGIEQGLAMRQDNNGIVGARGAPMQHGWLHCPSAPMDLRPLPPGQATADEWDAFHDQVEEFRKDWAFDRKESGLLVNPTSKWICPARANRAGCHSLGAIQVQAAVEGGLPVITPPEDWQTRPCCTNKTVDFTPDPENPHHQRKLMQREYYGSRRWRDLFKRRSMVEGVFGILKNSSRQRMRRGQNRMPGLATATLIAAVKIALFNEEQLRAWHSRTGRGPVDHPLLQPDPPSYGFIEATQEQAAAIVTEHFLQIATQKGRDQSLATDAA